MQDFFTGEGVDDVGPIAGYTDRDRSLHFIIKKTGGEQGGSGLPLEHAPIMCGR